MDERGQGQLGLTTSLHDRNFYGEDSLIYPVDRILANILDTSRERPIKIQTCFMNVHDEMPPPEEIHAYCDRVNHITANGGQISAIQLYTVSRPPAESYVTALTDDQMDQAAQMLQEGTDVPVEVYK